MNALQQQPECRLIFEKLKTELPAHLQYHNLHHTLDVCQRAKELALYERVEPADVQLLLVAAAYHDCGYLQQRNHHEAISCVMAKAILPAYGYGDKDLETICEIIMATKLPQQPQSLLEQIICDADLDYLGREDFFINGQSLYNELLYEGVVANETAWNEQQVIFLKNHHYFTATAITQRAAQKAINLNIIQQKLLNRDSQ